MLQQASPGQLRDHCGGEAGAHCQGCFDGCLTVLRCWTRAADTGARTERAAPADWEPASRVIRRTLILENNRLTTAEQICISISIVHYLGHGDEGEGAGLGLAVSRTGERSGALGELDLWSHGKDKEGLNNHENKRN